MANLLRPSVEEAHKYIDMWDSEKYAGDKWADCALKKLFTETYPENKNLKYVLFKVRTLNFFYTTNIHFQAKYSDIAQHIVDLKIDQRLTEIDHHIAKLGLDQCLKEVDTKPYIKLVNDIAEGNEKFKGKIYSFATKYCSFHVPEFYPICNSFVRERCSNIAKNTINTMTSAVSKIKN